MIDPNLIAAAIVDKWSHIPALATAMGSVNGSLPNIIQYSDSYPFSNDVDLALRNLGAPGILVVWDGHSPEGETKRIGHHFSVFIRMGKVGSLDPPSGYGTLVKLMTEGISTTDPEQLPFLYSTVHPDCDPPDYLLPQRYKDGDSLNYFLLTFTLVERI